MSTVQTLAGLATNPAILASAALAVTATALASVSAARRPPLGAGAALTITAVSTVTAIAVSGQSLDRYRPDNAVEQTTATGWLAVLIVTALIGLTFRTSASSTSRRDATLLLAGAAIGIYLCVPETDLLRLLPVAIAVPAMAVFFGWINPYGPLTAAAMAAALGWIALVDGSARASSIVGSIGCLLAVSLLPTSQQWWGSTSHRLARTGIYVLTMVGCSRVAGLRASASGAIVSLGVVAVASAVALQLVHRGSGTNPTSHEPG